jgi:methylase of polypeptide subunit release factors
MPDRFQAERVLASAPAVAALEGLAARLRAAGYANQVLDGAPPPVEATSRMALGLDTDRRELSASEVEALVAAGAADVADQVVVPRFALYAQGPSLVLLPRDDGLAPDRVYFGRDSLWLAETARRAGPGRGALADLGTGAGAVAALLAPDYERVVATDIAPRTAASAALTLRLNPRSGPARGRRDGTRPAGVACVADVADGLRPGSFDLVTANPPWVPDLGPGGVRRTYARGGETGFELPRRFVMEAAGLLAPGGVAVVLGIDVTWVDGSRPLVALARGLRRLGHEAVIVPSEAADAWPTLEADLTARFEGMASVAHVVLLIHRPPGPEPGHPARSSDLS